ncbi:hypothetical protein BH10PLA2_BH10PLA2_32610 [soil metagenome]
MAGGSWALLEELYESGDPAFVAELRQLHDVERLGTFAARWCADSRPAARQLLADYLALPFNAYRHEALIKRLFKGAEKAGDDEAMGLFLVAFDRLVRRSRLTVTRSVGEAFATHEQANAQIREWEALGYAGGSVYGSGRSFQASAHRQETVIRARRNTMPRPRQRLLIKASTIPNEVRQHMEKSYVLFSVPTRRYLRRRAWRYFRKLGQADAARYRKAAVNYLKRYTDRDVDSDIHLLDNWGLVHTLFGKSPALVHPAR